MVTHSNTMVPYECLLEAKRTVAFQPAIQAKAHVIAPVLIKIRPSRMLPGQIGLFAARFIKRGAVIADAKRFEDFFHPWKDFQKVNRVTKKKIKQCCIQTEAGFYAPLDFNWLPVPWNMNHSCEWNVGFDKNESFVTARFVRPGEELCWDYGMGISNPKFRLRCECGSRACRKVITGNDWKDEAYRNKHRKYFSRKLLKAAGGS